MTCEVTLRFCAVCYFNLACSLPTDCCRGYDDPNFRNGQVLTPAIDRMVAEGVEIKEFCGFSWHRPNPNQPESDA